MGNPHVETHFTCQLYDTFYVKTNQCCVRKCAFVIQAQQDIFIRYKIIFFMQMKNRHIYISISIFSNKHAYIY